MDTRCVKKVSARQNPIGCWVGVRRVRPSGVQGTRLGVQGTGTPRAPAVPPLGGAAGKFFSF